MNRRLAPLRWISAATALVALPLVGYGCGDPSPYYEGDGSIDTYCRDNPEDCEGEIGGECRDTLDCGDGVCCTDKNCGGGMCTYRCAKSADCPNEMLCEHDYCFFRCNDDRDCGRGQSCEHGKTICEYEGGK